MKLIIHVTLQSHRINNGQLVQRQVIRQEYNLPDTETLDEAFLNISAPIPGSKLNASIIQK